MKILKEGGHRLFETDPETARYVADLLGRLRRDGLDAVRQLSVQFDDWSPASFELTEKQIAEAIAQCPPQLVEDTAFCQGNVRRFAQAQLKMAAHAVTARVRVARYGAKPRGRKMKKS